ncbi:MAG: hypothetical protein U0003_02275 [Vampirovibrionales bacterium]
MTVLSTARTILMAVSLLPLAACNREGKLKDTLKPVLQQTLINAMETNQQLRYLAQDHHDRRLEMDEVNAYALNQAALKAVQEGHFSVEFNEGAFTQNDVFCRVTIPTPISHEPRVVDVELNGVLAH